MSDTNKTPGIKKCGFCGTTEGPMVKGVVDKQEVHICFKCINICEGRIKKQRGKNKQLKLAKNLKPSLINKILSEYIIGQDMAKIKVAVAIYNHHKMNQYIDEHDGKPPVNIERSNVVFVGPTGCGKTEMIRALAREYDLPLGISDATNLTEAGYVGKKI